MCVPIMNNARGNARAWAHYESLRTAAGAVSIGLADRGIQAVFVKGIVSARRLYDDPIERPMSDIDVRVTSAELMRVPAIAKTLGWQKVHDVPSYGAQSYLVGGQLVELECFLGPPYFSKWSIEELRARAHPVTDLGNAEAICLEPDWHDQVLISVLNAVKDKLATAFPYSIEDVRRYLRATDTDPIRLHALAKSRGIEAALCAAVHWVGALDADVACLDRQIPWSPSANLRGRGFVRVARSDPRGVSARVAMRLLGSPQLWPQAAIAVMSRAMLPPATK